MTISTYLGRLRLTQQDDNITEIAPSCLLSQDKTDLLIATAHWVNSYLVDPYHAGPFPYPISYAGTLYRQKIFNYVRRVPLGQTRSYKDVARICGGSPRAVGGALKHNKVLLAIPCHRITGEYHLGGYSGPEGKEGKRYLLNLESAQLKNPQCFT